LNIEKIEAKRFREHEIVGLEKMEKIKWSEKVTNEVIERIGEW
jgi:hypothetical protein